MKFVHSEVRQTLQREAMERALGRLSRVGDPDVSKVYLASAEKFRELPRRERLKMQAQIRTWQRKALDEGNPPEYLALEALYWAVDPHFWGECTDGSDCEHDSVLEQSAMAAGRSLAAVMLSKQADDALERAEGLIRGRVVEIRLDLLKPLDEGC